MNYMNFTRKVDREESIRYHRRRNHEDDGNPVLNSRYARDFGMR